VKTTRTLFPFRLRWKNQLQSIKVQPRQRDRGGSKEHRWKPVKRAEAPLSRRNSDTDSNSQNTRKPLRSLTSQELSQPKANPTSATSATGPHSSRTIISASNHDDTPSKTNTLSAKNASEPATAKPTTPNHDNAMSDIQAHESNAMTKPSHTAPKSAAITAAAVPQSSTQSGAPTVSTADQKSSEPTIATTSEMRKFEDNNSFYAQPLGVSYFDKYTKAIITRTETHVKWVLSTNPNGRYANIPLNLIQSYGAIQDHGAAEPTRNWLQQHLRTGYTWDTDALDMFGVFISQHFDDDPPLEEDPDESQS